MTEHKQGDLQVWWIPQVPMKPFLVPVSSVAEGVKILDTLAAYDQFQYENRVKPDYCNAGGLSLWNEDPDDDEMTGWVDWYDEETGEDDPREWLRAQAAD
jgi:hypothetical protein